jgi:hypothetical protein
VRKRILIASLIALCGAVLIVEVLSSKKDHPRPMLSVSFQSYSNSPTGSCFANLNITNRDSCNVRFDSSGWLQFTGTNTEIDAPSVIDYSVLNHGASRVLVVEVPPHLGRWRIVWAVTRLAPRERIRIRLPDWRIFRDFRHRVDTVGFASEWVPHEIAEQQH